MNKRYFKTMIRLFLTLSCILCLTLTAWAEGGPGSDSNVTVVNTTAGAKAAEAKTTIAETTAKKTTTAETTAAEATAAETGSEEAAATKSRVITCGTGESTGAGSAVPVQTETTSPETGKKGTSLGMYTTTGYCNCSVCSGGHSLTYSGTVPKARHTVSADLSVFPIGTRLMVGGVIYTVEDMGSGVNGKMLDIYYDNHDAAIAHGMKTEEVFTVEP